MSEPMPNMFQLEVPSDVPSVYADFANLWHTPDVFVLDFISLTQPPVPAEAPDGTPVVGVPCKVVQRVRIPPSQVFELMKTLEKQLSAWEIETGQKPGQPPADA